MSNLSIAVIGPDQALRQDLIRTAGALGAVLGREFSMYPQLRFVGGQMEVSDSDAVLVELDSNPEAALALMRQVSEADASVTVMAYSVNKDPEAVVRCMRSGAREFLSVPLSLEQMKEAFAQASARKPEGGRPKPKIKSKVVAVLGAKGGIGVTTVATNLALALRRESSQTVALTDVNLFLGDAAMMLGLEPRYNIVDALGSSDRFDSDFVSALLVDHPAGISVLAGPDAYDAHRAVKPEALGALLGVLKQLFSYVVVDAGQGTGLGAAALELADVVYMVLEADVPTLRNAQRLLTHFHGLNGSAPRLELVLNRLGAKDHLNESQVAKTLGVAVNWRIPNDYLRVNDALNRGVPVADNNSPVDAALGEIARDLCGKPSNQGRAGNWMGLFRKASANG